MDAATPVLTSTKGEANLPRYFATAFEVASRLGEGRLDFILPDGRRFRIEGRAPGIMAEIQVLNADLFARLVREGDLGFCDAYLDGWWTSPNLQDFLDLIQRPANNIVGDAYPGLSLLRAYERMRFWLQSNSKRQAKKNIQYHYDLGNEFYRLWLDETMTYSSAIFQNPQESLEAAQTRKYASMVDQMGAQAGEHVLEIGCGWGGFAEYAAKERGLRVTGLTISQAQHDFAVERIAKAGLSDRVQIKLQDYRDERGSYDGIASIEMFEAVGERYWPVYFDSLRERLKPGRNATLQIITIADERWHLYRKGVDFIQKYIFPGGMLPAPSVLRAEVEKAGLRVKGSIEFGESYSLTLRRWHETFSDRWADVRKLGFDERFKRMWDFYLASCAGAFHGGNCDVTQITVTRPR
ncbi:MAG: cyclopropane-fatty-acyl-phospholipid synthase family protein [Tabrizicola sp.]|jgi:cyclopropane-fatty-acyl-phospholipid synthase|nr:cyclopropane-fatty-acyl-phospholipid synthase family protein [Tabrizicola sp.]